MQFLLVVTDKYLLPGCALHFVCRDDGEIPYRYRREETAGGLAWVEREGNVIYPGSFN